MRIMFLEGNGLYWIEVLDQLRERRDWSIQYWVATEEFRDPVRDRFPQAIFHETYHARMGMPPKGYMFAPGPEPGEKLHRALSIDQIITFKMMDRLDAGDSLDYTARTDLYHNLVRYWHGALTRLRPDALLFPTSPHVVYDYVAYALAKHLGIRTHMFERTAIRGLVLPTARFEEGPSGFETAYVRARRAGGKTSMTLSKSASAHLSRLRGDYEQAMPDHLRFKLAASEIRSQSIFSWRKLRNVNRYLNYMRLFPGVVFSRAKRLRLPRAWFYGRWRGRNLPMDGLSLISGWRYLLEVRHKRARLQRCYKALARAPDLSVPYIYLALHCQPERSTSPDGGLFVHQDIMVALLSAALPEGWKLYVKEHVSQFRPYQQAERGRTVEQYKRMSACPGVSLVPIEASSFELIDRARAVATVTGTAGWEALVRGVPALVFGYAWYAGCHGAYRIQSLDECKQALAVVASGARPTSDDIRACVVAAESIGCHAYVDPISERTSGITYDENVRNLTVALASALEANQDDAPQQAAATTS